MRFTRAIVVSCLIVAAAVFAASAGEGKSYGKGLSGEEITKVSEIYAQPDKYVGKTVRIEGLVTDVCLKRGCWMMIAGDKEFESLRIKVDDGVITFPAEAKGKRAIAEGVLAKIELTPEQALAQAKHLAEEQRKPFDPAMVKDFPTVMYQLKGTGAVIK